MIYGVFPPLTVTLQDRYYYATDSERGPLRLSDVPRQGLVSNPGHYCLLMGPNTIARTTGFVTLTCPLEFMRDRLPLRKQFWELPPSLQMVSLPPPAPPTPHTHPHPPSPPPSSTRTSPPCDKKHSLFRVLLSSQGPEEQSRSQTLSTKCFPLQCP